MTLEALGGLVGREIGVSEWLTVGQDRIDRFAEASGDAQWIHVDAARAALESPFEATIAHGFLTLSLLSELSRAVLPVEGARMRVNYGLNRVRFPAPVKVNARVRARFTLQSLKQFEGGSDATLAVTMELEGGSKPCCVAEWILRYYVS